MGHILWVEPVFKEMIWGGNQLKEKYGYAIPSDQQENAGHLQHIQMVIIKSKKENSKDKHFQKFLMNTVNFLEISKINNFHCL